MKALQVLLSAALQEAPADLTQAELVRRMQALEAEVTYNQVNNWFRGRGRPGPAEVPALIRAMEMKPERARALLDLLDLSRIAELGAELAAAEQAA